jgi:general secretion pathway protein I
MMNRDPMRFPIAGPLPVPARRNALRLAGGERQEKRVKSEKGFTLIEVIIALAILGIALTVIIELFSGGLRLGRVSQEYTQAMNFASLKMEEIVTQKTIEAGEDEGEFDKIFRWQTGIEKVDILPYDKGTEFKPPVDFFHIRVKVLWTSGSKERSASIESYKTVKPES